MGAGASTAATGAGSDAVTVGGTSAMLAAGTVDSPVASAASTGTWDAGVGVGVGVATAVAGNVFSGAAAEAMPGAAARGGPKPIHAASASTVAPSNSTAISRPRGGVAVAVAVA